MNMRLFMKLSALAGIVLLAVLLIRHGGSVWSTVAAVRWAIVPVIALHVLQVVLSGAGWHAIAEPKGLIPARTYLVARWIREGVSCLLPVAQLGGEVVGARLVTLAGARASQAAAGVTVDLTVEAITQIIFTVCGLGFALATGIGAGLVGYTIAGLVAFLPGVLGLILLQKRGVFSWLERAAASLTRRWPGLRTEGLRNVHQAIEASYREPRRLLAASGFHLLGWFAGVTEVWLMAWAIDLPLSLGQALIIESIGQAIRSAAFFVPAAIGVQEGGMLLIATQLGLPAQAGLALALVKRLREVALGVPALAAWHIIEGRHLATGPTPLSAGAKASRED